MIITLNGREHGVPGINLDPIDVQAGMAMATRLGYGDGNMQMLVSYCLSRWTKGEEHLAESTALHMGMDLTSWRMCLSAAMAAATTTPKEN